MVNEDMESKEYYENIITKIEKLRDFSFEIEEKDKIKDINYANSKSGKILQCLMNFEKSTNVKISSLVDLENGLAIASAFKKAFNEEIFNYYCIRIIQSVFEAVKNIFGVPRTDLAEKLGVKNKIINSIPRLDSILISLEDNESIFIKQINDVAFLSVLISKENKNEIGLIKLYTKNTLEKQIIEILYPEKSNI